MHGHYNYTICGIEYLEPPKGVLIRKKAYFVCPKCFDKTETPDDSLVLLDEWEKANDTQ